MFYRTLYLNADNSKFTHYIVRGYTSVFIMDFTQEDLDIFYLQIGHNVKKWREKKGLTQLELSQELGHNSVGHVAKSELYKYGKHFSLENLYKIAAVLEIDIRELLVFEANN